MYKEERLKMGIDIGIIFFGVQFLTTLLSQIIIALIDHKNLVTVTTRYLNIVLLAKPMLIFLLIGISYLLYKKFKLQVSETVLIISGILLIIASLNGMALVINSVIMSFKQVNQNAGQNYEMLRLVFISNVLAGIDNVISLIIGIWLFLFGEKKIRKSHITKL